MSIIATVRRLFRRQPPATVRADLLIRPGDMTVFDFDITGSTRGEVWIDGDNRLVEELPSSGRCREPGCGIFVGCCRPDCPAITGRP